MATLFLTAPKWKQLKCPTHERVNKTGSICIMEYYSAIKRSEVLIQATTGMNLKTITLKKKKKIMLSEKPAMKDHMLYDSVYMKGPEKANPERQKVDSWFLGARDWNRK